MPVNRRLIVRLQFAHRNLFRRLHTSEMTPSFRCSFTINFIATKSKNYEMRTQESSYSTKENDMVWTCRKESSARMHMNALHNDNWK